MSNRAISMTSMINCRKAMLFIRFDNDLALLQTGRCAWHATGSALVACLCDQRGPHEDNDPIHGSRDRQDANSCDRRLGASGDSEHRRFP